LPTRDPASAVEFFDARTTDRDKRKLRSDEKPIDGDENRDRDKSGDEQRRRHFCKQEHANFLTDNKRAL
jgi:hypothetical protein